MHCSYGGCYRDGVEFAVVIEYSPNVFPNTRVLDPRQARWAEKLDSLFCGNTDLDQEDAMLLTF